MNSIIRTRFRTKQLFNLIRLNYRCVSNDASNETSNETSTTEPKRSGYAIAFDKFEAQIQQVHDKTVENQTFAYLLRNSKLMDLGDPSGKIVYGRIFKVIDDDLYIDFGWKFHCVCPKPKNKPGAFVRGAKVRILIKDLELSSKFLGYEKDITLLEADAVLLGLVQDRPATVN